MAAGTAATGMIAAAAFVTSTVFNAPETSSAAMSMSSDGLQMAQPTSRSSPTATTTTTTSKPKPKPTTTTTTTPPPTTTTEKPAPPPPPPPESCPTELEGTDPHVAQVGHHVMGRFDIDSVGGQEGRSGTSDHPEGLALDFMVDSATGDTVADYVLAHQGEFGVTYVIWEQRYNDGSGWSTMDDRGSATANHYDHVHVSFAAGAEVDVTC